MSAHTPGPWLLEKCACGRCERYGTDNGNFPQGAGYSLADARLIAAAPTLAEALREFVTAADMAMGNNEPGQEYAEVHADVVERARAALAEAGV